MKILFKQEPPMDDTLDFQIWISIINALKHVQLSCLAKAQENRKANPG